MTHNRKMVFAAVALLTVAVALLVRAGHGGLQVVRAQTARGGPIHGYVGAALSAEAEATVVVQGPVINLPDISVFAKNVRTGVSSVPVKRDLAANRTAAAQKALDCWDVSRNHFPQCMVRHGSTSSLLVIREWPRSIVRS